MTEALLATVDYGFSDMKLSTIEAYTEETNKRSRNLLERCGFNNQKTIQEKGFLKPQVFNMVIYVIDNKE